ncbi:MAG: cupin domain-containing protein [Gammaproteobacteria bacterium]
MALPHAASGEVIQLSRSDDDIASLTSVALVKTENMELIRLLLPKEREMPMHQVDGEITLLCLNGELVVDAHGKSSVLRPGEMLYLLGGVPHAVRANEDSVGLLTILLEHGDGLASRHQAKAQAQAQA